MLLWYLRRDHMAICSSWYWITHFVHGDPCKLIPRKFQQIHLRSLKYNSPPTWKNNKTTLGFLLGVYFIIGETDHVSAQSQRITNRFTDFPKTTFVTHEQHRTPNIYHTIAILTHKKCFTSSDPHLTIILTVLLAFYLTYLLTFYLAFYLTNILTFYLAFYKTSWHIGEEEGQKAGWRKWVCLVKIQGTSPVRWGVRPP